MGNAFGAKERPVKEVLRENERLIKRAINDLDKEIRNMEKEQAKIVADIKRNAKAGQMSAAKSLAKGYTRSKNYITKFIMMKTQLKGIALQMQTMNANHSMTTAMAGVTKALQQMNKNMDMSHLTKVLADYAKENEIADTKQGMMGDLIDDTLAQEDDPAQEDMLISQVMDELGIDLQSSLAGSGASALPKTAAQAAAQPQGAVQKPMAAGAAQGPPPPPEAGAGGGGGGDMSDIEERLKNLRK